MYDGRVAPLMLCSMRHIPQCTQNCCGIHNFTNLTRVLSSTEVPRYWTGTRVLKRVLSMKWVPRYWNGYQVLNGYLGIQTGTRVLKWLAGYWNGYRVLNRYPGIQTGTRVLKWVAGYWKGVSGIEMGTRVLKWVPGYWTGTWVLKQVPGYWTGTRVLKRVSGIEMGSQILKRVSGYPFRALVMCIRVLFTEGDWNTQETHSAGRLGQQTGTTAGHTRTTGQPHWPSPVWQPDWLFTWHLGSVFLSRC